ncbi:sulfite exporter TauE/SafE family protein [Acinetobacter sp. MD2]|uniref:sulfite exporter TauE/SafE family protein n=1 Tax=Acinetobacter sp. MD2 TaxID=2600066 RepID=UPI002D1F66B4|nr:sulfite exporter TauE/SafE family protein [Acinetobacter sp. MD2]MEB3766569.1 sulfite exporter TauE/SafE family protein [Acinetobacter sp. MD2]
MLVLLISGLMIGCLLGLTGAGGGILAVPMLMASQGWTVAQAAPVGLLAVTLSTFIGSLQGLYQGIVRYRAAIWIAIMSIPSSHFAIGLSHQVPTVWLMLCFAITMLVVAYRMFSAQHEEFHNPPCRIHPQTGKLIWDMYSVLVLSAIGVLAGFLTGLLGVGGGFVIIPALKKATNLSMQQIVATSLMIICLVGGMSIVLHALDGFHYPMPVSAYFSASCLIGLLVGRCAIAYLATSFIQRIFATVVIIIAVLMLVKSLWMLYA